jgi:hypothetical protein
MKQRIRDSNPYRGAVGAAGGVRVLWTDASGTNRDHVLTGPVDLGLEHAQVSRKGYRYQHRRNYEGEYYCAGSDQMIWFESMAEYSALLHLDHTRSLAAVSAQPCCLVFDDNTRHYPDFYMVTREGARSLLDVRPVDRIRDEDRRAFARTGRMCDLAGWGYEVLHGVIGWELQNLEFLSAYRIGPAAPTQETRDRIHSLLRDGPKPLGDLCRNLDCHKPWKFLPPTYHLMFIRDLSYDESRPFTVATRVWLEE